MHLDRYVGIYYFIAYNIGNTSVCKLALVEEKGFKLSLSATKDLFFRKRQREREKRRKANSSLPFSAFYGPVRGNKNVLFPPHHIEITFFGQQTT